MDIKKTAFGTAAAAALIVAGTAVPAMAGDTTEGTGYSKWSSYSSQKTTDLNVSPEVDVLGGGILNGDIGIGNAVGSGNDFSAPILSGNETAVGNGNETAIGNVSGNEVSDIGNVSDVGNVSTEVEDVVDNVTDTSLTDIVDVDDILGDVGGWVNVDGMFDN